MKMETVKLYTHPDDEMFINKNYKIIFTADIVYACVFACACSCWCELGAAHVYTINTILYSITYSEVYCTV